MADVTIDIELVTKAFNSALKTATNNVKGFEQQMDRAENGVTNSFKRIENSAQSASRGFTVLRGSVASFVGNLAANAVSSFASTLSTMATSVVDNTIKLEQLQTQFTVLTGSAQVADKTLKDIQQFAATTPFQLEGIAAAGAQLIGFGTSADELIPRLTRIGDVAASVNKPIGDLALIFGQVQAAGKLTGERLLQLEERAVPIGQALAETLNVPREAVRDLVSQGVVDFETFTRAFDSISDEGGQAFGGMIRQSQTLGGLISTLKDNLSLLGTDIGQVLLPALRETAAQMIEFIQANRDLIVNIATKALQGLAQVAAFSVRVFNVLSAAVDAVVIAYNGLKLLANELIGVWVDSAQRALDFAIALRAITGADPSPTLENLKRNLQDFKNIQEGTSAEIIKNIEDRKAAREEEGAALQDLANRIASFGENVQQNESNITENQQLEADRRQQIREEEALKAAEAERAKQEAVNAVREQFKAEREIIEVEAEIAEAEQNELDLEDIRNLEQEKLAIVRDAELEKAATIKDINERAAAEEAARQKFNNESLKADLRLRKDLRAQDKKDREQEAQFERQLLNSRLSAASGFLQAGLTLARQGSKEQKVLQSANALVSTYTAANQALSSPPGPPFTIPLVAATIAQGLANVAKINSAGNFQSGGIIGGTSFSGDNLTANVNSGELILNRGQQQRLFDIANGNAAPSASNSLSEEAVRNIVESTVANMQVTLVADDTELARSVSRGVTNGVVIGTSS